VQARPGAVVAHVHHRLAARDAERGLRDLRRYAERRAEPFLPRGALEKVSTRRILRGKTYPTVATVADRRPSRVGTVERHRVRNPFAVAGTRVGRHLSGKCNREGARDTSGGVSESRENQRIRWCNGELEAVEEAHPENIRDDRGDQLVVYGWVARVMSS
jgi:hypothetical protein